MMTRHVGWIFMIGLSIISFWSEAGSLYLQERSFPLFPLQYAIKGCPGILQSEHLILDSRTSGALWIQVKFNLALFTIKLGNSTSSCPAFILNSIWTADLPPSLFFGNQGSSLSHPPDSRENQSLMPQDLATLHRDLSTSSHLGLNRAAKCGHARTSTDSGSKLANSGFSFCVLPQPLHQL